MVLKLNERSWANIADNTPLKPETPENRKRRENLRNRIAKTKRVRNNQELANNTAAVMQGFANENAQQGQEAENEEAERAGRGNLAARQELSQKAVQYAKNIGQKYKGSKSSLPCRNVIGEHKGEECWAHEYTDPVTGRLMTPHTCPHIHPGQRGWRDEFYTPKPKPQGSWRGGRKTYKKKRSTRRRRN